MLYEGEIMNELDRLVELSELHLDYTTRDVDLDDLTRLAARVCGARVALVNLIDRYSQWTVARYGLEIDQMPREDSVCQYTIRSEEPLELKGLKNDARFSDKDYVCGGAELDYYYGVPLKTKNGAKIGALCVLDIETLDLSREQTTLLAKVAELVVYRLEFMKQTRQLQERLDWAERARRKAGHDIRGPVSGILGIIELLRDELKERGVSGLDEMLDLMENSGEGVLELADSILKDDKPPAAHYTCEILAEKLESLYAPQAKAKQVELSVSNDDDSDGAMHFSPKTLLQIGGNLINNALKFTPEGGSVAVRIFIEKDQEALSGDLIIEVDDNGSGMSGERIDEIMEGRAESTWGTEGERGFGLGLPLVRQLVEKENGSLEIKSKPGEGCGFTVRLPI